MKKIYIYKNTIIVVDEQGETQVSVNNEKPLEIVEATPKNMAKYFPNHERDVEALKTIKV